MSPNAPLTFRPATAADAEALERLAQLDSSRPLTGPVLVAESSGRILAAVSLEDRRTVADPFRHTATQLRLLREAARASQPSPRVRRPRAIPRVVRMAGW